MAKVTDDSSVRELPDGPPDDTGLTPRQRRVLAAGAELIYLSLVPQSSRFRRLVRSWKYAAEKKQQQIKVAQLMMELPTDLQRRYAQMVDTVGSIRRNYSTLSHSSQMFTSQMDQRLAGLLDSYLRLLHAAHQHGEYLRTTDTDDIVKEVARLEREALLPDA